ncbi:MAG: DEAD/DEAH box helicase [Patescibacteria group bacterium]|nr:DEAD/DEAH box helicase [Patescibacteria group bacterium]
MSYEKQGGHSRQRGSFGRHQGRRPQRRFTHQGAGVHYSKFINKSTGEVAKPYEPKHSFNDFLIDPRIKANIAKKGYIKATPIQDQAIPVILEGRDVVGVANTGTGKTGAFLIPLLDKVIKTRNERVLIIVPTRELALQIEEEYRGFSQGIGLRSVSVVGGANINPQIRSLRDNPYFVIGTPGRLKDLIERRVLDLSKFQTVVLDEADRMLDMGFIGDMRYIMSLMPAKRHTLFFSATLGADVERLIQDFLTNPVRISVKTGDTSKNIDQDIVRIEGKNKVDVLRELLSQPEFDKVLIFGRTKHGVEKLSKILSKLGIPSASIHGNKSQNHRQRSLGEFKQNKVRVLVATDVAARGLDIPKVSHVINYDAPHTYEDYVHRIGRTGRAGERGKALTFVE